MANFSDRQEDILIQIPAAQLQQLNFVPGPFVGRELLTGQNNINMDFQKGVSLQMIPYGCCIFDIKKGP